VVDESVELRLYLEGFAWWHEEDTAYAAKEPTGIDSSC